MNTVDRGPIDNEWYDALGDAWWDPEGPVRAFHEVDPVRSRFFREQLERLAGASQLSDLRVLDLGCGAGLMAEGYARAGAWTVGLDLSATLLAAGRRHWQQRSDAVGSGAGAGAGPSYVRGRAEGVPFGAGSFDAVCTADALEHVDDLAAVLDECARVLRPGGLLVFDTINRTWRSRVGMIWAAQRLLRFAPPRTHAYTRFIRPAELREALEGRGFVWGEHLGLALVRNPLLAAWSYGRGGPLGGFELSDDDRVSYVGYAYKTRA